MSIQVNSSLICIRIGGFKGGQGGLSHPKLFQPSQVMVVKFLTVIFIWCVQMSLPILTIRLYFSLLGDFLHICFLIFLKLPSLIFYITVAVPRIRLIGTTNTPT